MSLKIPTPTPFTTASSGNDHNVYACIGRFERNARSASSKADHIGSTTRCIANSERRRLTYWWKCWLALLVGLLRRCCGCGCRCCILRGGLGGDEAWQEGLSTLYVYSACSDCDTLWCSRLLMELFDVDNSGELSAGGWGRLYTQ